MKTTYCQNEVLCPYCGKRFKSKKWQEKDYPSENIDAIDYQMYKEKCPHCKNQLLIEFKREIWFTAEKI